MRKHFLSDKFCFFELSNFRLKNDSDEKRFSDDGGRRRIEAGQRRNLGKDF